MKLSFISTLAVAVLTSQCLGFAPQPMVQHPMSGAYSSHPLTKSGDMTLAPTFVLRASHVDPEKEEKKEEELALIAGMSWKEIKHVNNEFWDYTCNFLYIFLGTGIILNFSGFAYTVTPDKGLNVMPLSQYREEKLWKQEMQNYEREAAEKHAFLLKQSQGVENSISDAMP